MQVNILGKTSRSGNMMLNDKVVPAMKKAFEENSELSLAERIIKVFEAAEESVEILEENNQLHY